MLITISFIAFIMIVSFFMGVFYEQYKNSIKTKSHPWSIKIQEAKILAHEYLSEHSKKIMKTYNPKIVKKLLEEYWPEAIQKRNNTLYIDGIMFAKYIINNHYKEIFSDE